MIILIIIMVILFIISLDISHYDSYDNPESIIWPSLTIVCFSTMIFIIILSLVVL